MFWKSANLLKTYFIFSEHLFLRTPGELLLFWQNHRSFNVHLHYETYVIFSNNIKSLCKVISKEMDSIKVLLYLLRWRLWTFRYCLYGFVSKLKPRKQQQKANLKHETSNKKWPQLFPHQKFHNYYR